MIDMFGEVGVEVGVLWDCMGRIGLEGEGVDTVLERQIFSTMKIGRNVKDKT